MSPIEKLVREIIEFVFKAAGLAILFQEYLVNLAIVLFLTALTLTLGWLFFRQRGVGRIWSAIGSLAGSAIFPIALLWWVFGWPLWVGLLALGICLLLLVRPIYYAGF